MIFQKKNSSNLFSLLKVGLVAGNGAWKDGKVYRYMLQMYAKNNKDAMLARARLTIFRQTEDMLIGQITHGVYGKTDQQFTEDTTDLTKMKSEYNEWPLDKRFKIHMDKDVIRSISVDTTMTSDQVEQLKVIVSQLQVDTKGQNLIKMDDNRVPDGNNGVYKVMEWTMFGKCETTYDISPVSDYLQQSYPVGNVKGDGDLIKIEKTRNMMNCEERRETQNDMKSGEKTPLRNRIMIAGDLNDFTIQSTTATSMDGDSVNYIGLTLEMVDDRKTMDETFVTEDLIHKVEYKTTTDDNVMMSSGKQCKKVNGE